MLDTELREKLANYPRPVTPHELYVFMYLMAGGENIPSVAVCPDHQTPWDLCESAFFNKHGSLLAIGPRGGGKTRTLAKLVGAELFFVDGVEIANVGAIEKQAGKCYRYVETFLKTACPQRLVRAIRSETRLDNQALFEQLVGTVSGVNSPHPNKLRVDEVELMKREVLEELMMVPTSNKQRGIPSNLILTSTRKYNSGTVQHLLDQKDNDLVPFVWCYKEVAENCGLERRGSGRKRYVIKDYYNAAEDGEYKTIEVEAWSNCGSCPLLPSCRGDLARSQGYYAIEDLIRVFRRVNISTWIQQMDCRRALTTGLVYPQFDEATHTGDYPYNPELAMDISLDFGFSNPAAVGFWQEDEDSGVAYLVDEIYESGLTTEALANRIKEVLKKYKLTPDHLRYGLGDSEQAQQIADLRDHGIHLEAVKKGTIVSGLDAVRRYLHSFEYGVRIRIDRGCVNHINEIKKYRNKTGPDGQPSENPVDRDNHGMDELRYYITFLESSGEPNILLLD